MLSPAKLQNGSLRCCFVTRLRTLIEHPANATRYHRAIEHDGPQPTGAMTLSLWDLRIGLFQLADFRVSVAQASLARHVQPVYGMECTSLVSMTKLDVSKYGIFGE